MSRAPWRRSALTTGSRITGHYWRPAAGVAAVTSGVVAAVNIVGVAYGEVANTVFMLPVRNSSLQAGKKLLGSATGHQTTARTCRDCHSCVVVKLIAKLFIVLESLRKSGLNLMKRGHIFIESLL